MSYTKYAFGKDIPFKVVLLTEDTYHFVRGFKCGNTSINDYLQTKALFDDLGTTYLVIDTKDSVAIGYCTMCCSGITFRYQNNVRTLPSIEIRYFAITNRLHKLLFDDIEEHYYFSDYILGYFMNKCSEISEEHLAARYILLYSVKDAVNFYKRIGFTEFTDFFEPDQYRYIDGCKPMYIEIS